MSIPFRKKRLPEIGEIVIARITKIIDKGAYAELLEFEKNEAFIPWSEITTKSIRDIRDVLKEGQVVIGKVIRVDKKPYRVEVDISLKRVTEGEKRVLMLRWKRLQKAQKIIEIVTKKLNRSLDEAYENVWIHLEKNVDPFSLLEECVIKGPTVLINYGIPKDWSEALCEEAKKHIQIKTVKLRAILKLVSLKPDGVERIRKTLENISSSIQNKSDVKLSIYTIGAPRYRIEVEALDYKKAEEILANISDILTKTAKELELDEAELQREEISK